MQKLAAMRAEMSQDELREYNKSKANKDKTDKDKDDKEEKDKKETNVEGASDIESDVEVLEGEREICLLENVQEVSLFVLSP